MRKILTSLIFIALSVSAATDLQKLEYMGNVKDIIIHTQKVRGGTYNFLNGSEFAQFGVFQERSKQKQAYRSLDRQFKIAGKSIDSEFDKLRKYNSSLNKTAFQLEPLTSFSAYGSLINKMISTNQRLQSEFFAKSKPMLQTLTKVMVNDLIPLSEGLGKIRGLGSGVIAKTYSEDEEVDMLESYVHEIKKHLKNSMKNMQTLSSTYPKKYPEKFNTQLSELKKNVNKYVKFAEQKLIDKSDINENPNEYFDRGTSLISNVMAIYSINEEILRDAL